MYSYLYFIIECLFFFHHKYIPPLDRIAGFFGGKPMDRKVIQTSLKDSKFQVAHV